MVTIPTTICKATVESTTPQTARWSGKITGFESLVLRTPAAISQKRSSIAQARGKGSSALDVTEDSFMQRLGFEQGQYEGTLSGKEEKTLQLEMLIVDPIPLE